MYGGDMPAGFADQFGDIDEATRTAAASNQNSTLARLKTGYGTSREQFMRQLAARGGLQSSELNYGEDQLQRGFEQQQYDAGNQFLNDANGAYGDYLGVVNGNAQSLASAIGSAEGNVYANPAYRPVEADARGLRLGHLGAVRAADLPRIRRQPLHGRRQSVRAPERADPGYCRACA
jgi:hypothetical protein